jgi:acetyl-CoA synthetase
MSDIIWRPTEEGIAKTNVKRFMDKHGIKTYQELIKRSIDDIEWFWDACLKDVGVEWYQPYRQVLDLSKGIAWAKWFIGGQINIVHNCLDRHLRDGHGQDLCMLWEGDDKVRRRFTYAEMNALVGKIANALRADGIGKGDFVGLFMPMVPENVAVFFACLKIGAVVIPVFSGFGAMALATRLADAGAKVLFTADGGIRRGKAVNIKQEADRAAAEVKTIRRVVVYQRTGQDVPMQSGRDVFFNDYIKGQPETAKTEVMAAEDMFMVIYTSGTTGKPKGTVHTHAGSLSQVVKEVGYACDVKPNDVFFWPTDIGWMMGPWEFIGCQFYRTPYLVYEGTPNYPEPDRLWNVIEENKVTELGISPTAVRLMKAQPDEFVEKHDFSRLRLLASSGEPWDPESYMWFFEKVGGKRCPIINLSGGTELMGCLLQPLPIYPLKVCTLQGPALAMDIDVFDEDGKSIKGGIGHLVCKKPGPSMTKGFLNDPQRYLDTYFSRWPNVWYHGDWALVDKDGFWFLHGRSDDTIKIAGKRTGPAEIESAVNEHGQVQESAAVGVHDELKGEAVVCFVVLKPGIEPNEAVRKEISNLVVDRLGKTLKPEKILFVKALPKTRSAKIVRGVIRKKYQGQDVGDLSSVENPEAVEEIGKAK